MELAELVIGTWKVEEKDETSLYTFEGNGRFRSKTLPKDTRTSIVTVLFLDGSHGNWWVEGDAICLKEIGTTGGSPLGLGIDLVLKVFSVFQNTKIPVKVVNRDTLQLGAKLYVRV
jgi:hypothetical protein